MKETSKYTLRFYWRHLQKQKRHFIIALTAIPLASVLVSTAVPYYFSQIIGRLSDKNFDDFDGMLWTVAIVGLIGVILNAIGFQSLTRLEAQIGALIRKDMFEQLVHKDARFFVNQKIGAMTGKYIDFFRSYVVLQDLLIIRTLGFVFSLITGLTILATKSPVVAGILLILLIILIWEVRWSLNKREPWREARRKHRTELFGKVADALTNSLVVKSFGNEDHEIRSAEKTNQLFKHAFIKDISFISAEGSARVGILVLAQIITVAVCAYLISKSRLDVATAIFVISYLQLVGAHLFSIGELLNGYEQALLDASSMSEMLMIQNSVVDSKTSRPLPENFKPMIRFEEVSYQYDDANEAALNTITIDIPAGQKIGIAGHSGSGKTTLSHLMLRFSDVTHGAITIDGHDIRDISQESLRHAVGYVPQEPALFHRSLRENISYGNPTASDEEIIDAAKKASAWDFIKKLPEGLDTIVGERGVKLSGGQRQRIAIARAILKDAPILVLDEATSALDSESEKLIQASLEELMKDRTSIVIAHRLSTISKLDRIIVLDKGRIAEDGAHEALLAQKGIYARLWGHQSGGFIED